MAARRSTSMGRRARRIQNHSSSRRRVCSNPCSRRTSRQLPLARARQVQALRQQDRQRERPALQLRRVKRRIVLPRKVPRLRLLRVKMKIAAGLRTRLLARHLMRRERSRPLLTLNRIAASGSRSRRNRTATNLRRVARTAPNQRAAPRVGAFGIEPPQARTPRANPARPDATATPARSST